MRGGSGSGFDAGWSVAKERLVVVGAGLRCALVRWGGGGRLAVSACALCAGLGAVEVRCLDEWRYRFGRKLHPRRLRRVLGWTDVVWRDNGRGGRVAFGVGGVGCGTVFVVGKHG